MAKTLTCPDCSTILTSLDRDWLHYEQCPRCKGVLLDPHEMKTFITKSFSPNQVPKQPIDLDHQVIKSFLHSTSLRCPRDQTPFEIINYSYDSNILLERCPNCEVVWVRHHQLLPLAQYLKGNPTMEKLGVALMLEDEKNRSNQELMRTPLARLSSFPVPVRDDLPSYEFPIVTISLIVVNSLIFLIQFIEPTLISSELYGFNFSVFTESLYSVPLVSHQFLHLNWSHLVSNMWILWIFGDNIEYRLGHLKFLLFYLLAGVVAALAFGFLSIDKSFTAVGASGAIAAIMGAYLVLYPKQHIRVLFWNTIYRWKARTYLLFWAVFQFVGFLIELGAGEPAPVAFVGHLAGFLFGLLVAQVLIRLPGVVARHEDISDRGHKKVH